MMHVFHAYAAYNPPFVRSIAPPEKDEAGQDNGLLPVERKYQHVTLTTRLLNSYLSVFYRHQSSEESHNMFCKLYDELGVERSARTYVEALERCGHAGR